MFTFVFSKNTWPSLQSMRSLFKIIPSPLIFPYGHAQAATAMLGKQLASYHRLAADPAFQVFESLSPHDTPKLNVDRHNLNQPRTLALTLRHLPSHYPALDELFGAALCQQPRIYSVAAHRRMDARGLRTHSWLLDHPERGR